MGLPAGQIQALQLSFEGLLKLYKSDHEAFLEKLKGITTLQETRLAGVVVEHMTNSLKGVEGSFQELNKLAASNATAGR
jgi:hypothetical protein